MKERVFVFVLGAFLILGIFSTGEADTILFPVIAQNQPNVTTIVSVINRPGGASTNLHYIYRLKDTFVGGDPTQPNISGTCASVSFTRPTFDGDLVSFDVSGLMNTGNALFGDTNSYGGTFSTSTTGAKRAYLLVSNSNASGTRVDVGNNIDLGGEAILLDLVFGAAWRYRGINDGTREDYTFVNANSGGGVVSALPSAGFDSRRFTFFPPSSWSTRFFITPICANMDSANCAATVNLISTGAVDEGVYDRNGTRFTFTAIDKSVVCTAGLDLIDLLDSTTRAAVANIGGWSWIRVASGDAIIFKLEFANPPDPPFGAINNGYLLSTTALP